MRIYDQGILDLAQTSCMASIDSSTTIQLTVISCTALLSMKLESPELCYKNHQNEVLISLDKNEVSIDKYL